MPAIGRSSLAHAPNLRLAAVEPLPAPPAAPPSRLQPAEGQFLDPIRQPGMQVGPVERGRLGAEERAPLLFQVGRRRRLEGGDLGKHRGEDWACIANWRCFVLLRSCVSLVRQVCMTASVGDEVEPTLSAGRHIVHLTRGVAPGGGSGRAPGCRRPPRGPGGRDGNGAVGTRERRSIGSQNPSAWPKKIAKSAR